MPRYSTIGSIPIYLSRLPDSPALALQPLREFEILLIICAIIFLALMLLGIGCSYYCLKKRNIRVIRRRPASTIGSEVTRISDPPSMFAGLKIPRAHATDTSGSEEMTESVHTDYGTDVSSIPSMEEFQSAYSDLAGEGEGTAAGLWTTWGLVCLAPFRNAVDGDRALTILGGEAVSSRLACPHRLCRSCPLRPCLGPALGSDGGRGLSNGHVRGHRPRGHPIGHHETFEAKRFFQISEGGAVKNPLILGRCAIFCMISA